MIRPLDRDELRRQYAQAAPFPFVMIDRFLEPGFAHEVAAAYPSFENAMTEGRSFKSVNERKKVQISEASRFPGPIAKLNQALASPTFLSDLSYVTGIPDLVADEILVGGGIHITGPGGRLDVHVDFNYIEDRKLFRRLNLLVYLNPVWESQWGGHIQLWDADVKSCRQAFAPVMNRCVIFETSEISFHGVTPVTSEAPYPRISFATYYYTHQPPPDWKGNVHSTVFKARPEERLRGYVLMPVEMFRRKALNAANSIKQGIRRLKNPVG